MSTAHQEILNRPGLAFLDTLSAIDDAIDLNADIAEDILAVGIEFFDVEEKPERGSEKDWQEHARALDLNKAHSTIRQFWRDWSKEGFETEVKPFLDFILHDLRFFLKVETAHARVLLPGAGLGRLLFELCLAGFDAEGNEISYHQLLASNFILNTTRCADQYALYPFLGNFNNHLHRQNQLHSVTIPDVHPSHIMHARATAGQLIGNMNMTAGDFITSYSSLESTKTFDSVVTMYFIDTAPNVIRYVETVYNCLDDDGIWINIGPMLWHFEDRVTNNREIVHDEDKSPASESRSKVDRTGIGEPGSFELTDEEMLTLVQNMGFELLSHSTLPAEIGGYIQDPRSMLQHGYRCSHWVARKRS